MSKQNRMEWFYRLGDADPLNGFLWSGRITTSQPVTRAQAKHLIRKKLRVARLPSRTIVMHAGDLAQIIAYYVISNCNSSFNVAPDINMSVEEIAISALLACNNGTTLKIKYDDSKPNGQYRKDVDTTTFKDQIKNFKFRSLTEGIKDIYEYYK